MTLEQYCNELGWNASDLSRQAGINWRTARKALDGEVIAAVQARQIAQALSTAYGRTIRVGDIQGLNYR